MAGGRDRGAAVAAALKLRRSDVTGGGQAWARGQLRDGTPPRDPGAASPASAAGSLVLIDGSQLFSAQAASAPCPACRAGGRRRPRVGVRTQILYNPGLKTSDIMIPGLAGVILVFVGTVITSLGVVRERQAGTLEQLAVMPLRPVDVFLGKIVPYFAVPPPTWSSCWPWGSPCSACRSAARWRCSG